MNTSAVRLVVDSSRCVGIGQCEVLQPEVFEIDDDGISQVQSPGLLDLADAQLVIDACPSGAISVGDTADTAD